MVFYIDVAVRDCYMENKWVVWIIRLKQTIALFLLRWGMQLVEQTGIVVL